MYNGRNPSDHVPVSLQLEVVPMVTGDVRVNPRANDGKVSWSSVKPEDLVMYESTMGELLDSLVIPENIIHGDRLCFCENHVFGINRYYCELLSVLEVADSTTAKILPW